MPYSHLRLQERYVIYHLKVFGLSLREIGRRLGRHHTTISRELSRNGPRYGGVYFHETAQRKADERWRVPRHCRRRSHSRLYRYVVWRLNRDWSPEQIVGRLNRQHHDDRLMRVSVETIYQWIYREAAAGGVLYSHLRRRHKRRRKHARYGVRRGLIPDRVSIDRRPETVDQRLRLGDWEGDTLEGARGRGALASHVERRSRYLIAARLADKTAETMATQTVRAFRRIPKRLRLTLTIDNGKEFARFKHISQGAGLDVYFADPYAPWQRATNENTNGLIRQYFPKGCDFQKISDKDIATMIKRLNHRPRKCLDFQTPHEVLLKTPPGALAI